MIHLFATVPAEAWIALGVVAVLATGAASLFRQSAELDRRIAFASEFREKFIEYANGRGEDNDAYHWLMFHSNRMQIEMGQSGTIDFRPPVSNYIFRNWPIVLNALPEIRRYFVEYRKSFGMFGTTLDSYIHLVNDALVRYLGSLGTLRDASEREIRNPLAWLRSGMELVLAGPLFLLSAFGLIGSSTVRAIRGAPLFKICAGLAALVGFVGSIVGLFVDWPQAIERARALWGG